MGFGIDRQQLKAKAAKLIVSLHLKMPYKDGDWVNAFIKRNGISLQSQVALSTVRSRMLNKTVTQKYFSALSDTVNKLNLHNKPN
ncbi:hypothetical protein DPMN_113263 [Dreissena polymorpha]|uniref:HTH CENPB-type domain-containing protein n=1 Tax=Dreissena polymorpha TaxID=45954 RepID=A0A9D4KHN0_DREPO|nr:hypothetical protein DPMN_113263 [Dreissena polymorpha]